MPGATAFDTRRSRRVPSLFGRVAGSALLFVAAGMLVSMVVELGVDGPEVSSLAVSALIVAVAGAVLYRTTSLPESTTSTEVFSAVGGTWVVAALAGAIPFLFAGTFPRIDDALFESISGFTGTGASVLSPIEAEPRGILFWRSMTQFYGGAGMVVLAVAILPYLGIGGMELLRTEAPGPAADRLAPRISEAAKRLWFVYTGFTVVAVLGLLAVGLSPYDAVTHAFTIVSTSGLSPYDRSIAEFDSVPVEVVVGVLMLGGATAFTLHWQFVTGDRWVYLRSSMFRWFIGMFVVFSAAITGLLWWRDGEGPTQALRHATFTVASLLSSTGLGSADYVQWDAGAQLLLLGIMLCGGMAGSTSGGLKLVRVRILLAFAAREIARVRHPRGVLPLRLGREVVPERTVGRAVGYILFYVLLVLIGTVLLAILGSGFTEAVGGAVSAMGNMGPALGEAGPTANMLVYERPARAVLMVMMFLGRLEIFPILFLVTSVLGPARALVARHRPHPAPVGSRAG